LRLKPVILFDSNGMLRHLWFGLNEKSTDEALISMPYGKLWTREEEKQFMTFEWIAKSSRSVGDA